MCSRGMNREVSLVAVPRTDRKFLLSSGCYKTRTLSRMTAVKMQGKVAFERYLEGRFGRTRKLIGLRDQMERKRIKVALRF